MSPAETAEPIQLLFGVWTHESPRNRVSVGDLNPPRDGVIFRGTLIYTWSWPTVKILKVNHKEAASGDAVCSPPLLWPLNIIINSLTCEVVSSACL